MSPLSTDLRNVRRFCVFRVPQVADMSLPLSLLVLVSAATSGCGTDAPARAAATAEPPRYALVIGQSRYLDMDALPTAENDGKDMCAALKQLRFDATCLPNLSRRSDFIAAVRSFVKRVPPGADVLLYYAGHAVQIAGENYLFPTQATGGDEGDWLPQLVPLSELFRISDGANAGFLFIVLDACRDNPLSAPGTATRNIDVRNTPIPRNTLVLFATAADSVAFGGGGKLSPLTEHLLAQIKRPQLTFLEAINKTIDEVAKHTELRYQKRQQPLIYGKFPSNTFCFDSCPQMVNVKEIEEQRRKAQQLLLQSVIVPAN